MKSLAKKMSFGLLGLILSFSSSTTSMYAKDIEDTSVINENDINTTSNTEDYIVITDESGEETKVYALSEEEHIAFRNSVEDNLAPQPRLWVQDNYILSTAMYTFICSDNNWFNTSVELFYCWQSNNAPQTIQTYMSNKGVTYGPYTVSQGGSAYFPTIKWNGGSYSIYAKAVGSSGTGLIQVWD